MTKVTIKKTRDGEYLSFTCAGHAGYNKRHATDKDIVCAAVSVLVINTLNSLEEFTDTNMQVGQDAEEGIICCQFTDSLSDKAKVLLDAMVLGLNCISKQYGSRFCKLKFEEV